MEKLIKNALLNMYSNDELSGITGTDTDDAYSKTNDIIAEFKAKSQSFTDAIALDDAICTAITIGLNHGFFDGVKVGLAIANTFTPKTDVAFIQKASKAVSA